MWESVFVWSDKIQRGVTYNEVAREIRARHTRARNEPVLADDLFATNSYKFTSASRRVSGCKFAWGTHHLVKDRVHIFADDRRYIRARYYPRDREQDYRDIHCFRE